VSRTTSAPSSIVLAAALDIALVLVFVLIGRSSHDEATSLVGALVTLWPFLAGLAVGWLVVRAWRRPSALLPTGVVIWVATVAIGMVLRVVSGQGIAVSFVIVASIVLGVFLLGWRAIAIAVRAARARRLEATGTDGR
jgi:hypothetical protein